MGKWGERWKNVIGQMRIDAIPGILAISLINLTKRFIMSFIEKQCCFITINDERKNRT
jgi:hypothetical protein